MTDFNIKTFKYANSLVLKKSTYTNDDDDNDDDDNNNNNLFLKTHLKISMLLRRIN
jgi:hypothetical protein